MWKTNQNTGCNDFSIRLKSLRSFHLWEINDRKSIKYKHINVSYELIASKSKMQENFMHSYILEVMEKPIMQKIFRLRVKKQLFKNFAN